MYSVLHLINKEHCRNKVGGLKLSGQFERTIRSIKFSKEKVLALARQLIPNFVPSHYATIFCVAR
jgi:hypothetical protein